MRLLRGKIALVILLLSIFSVFQTSSNIFTFLSGDISKASYMHTRARNINLKALSTNQRIVTHNIRGNLKQPQPYPGIEVVLESIQYIDPIPSDWHNLSYHYRLPIWVNETMGIERENELITINIPFEYGEAYNGSIAVYDNSTSQIIPFQVWNESFYSDTPYYSRVYVSWVVSMDPYEKKLYYVYWSDMEVDTPKFIGLNVTIGGTTNVTVYNYNYTLHLSENGIEILVDSEPICKSHSFAPSPFMSYPYNATYVLLDRSEDTAYDDADHVRIIAWEDNTHVKVYGFNTTSTPPHLDLLVETYLSKYQVLRYPSQGPISGYPVLKVESDKPVTILVGDLGTEPGYNAWGVDHGSDDDLYTYYGKEIVLWVPKDLWISAYYNETHVKVIDISDGDDSTEFTLDANEFWYAFAGPNGTGVGSPPVFDDDIVKIVADKPITIIGGFLDDNFFGEAKGHLQKRFVVPVFEAIGFIAYQDNTQINYTIVDSQNPSSILTSDSLTLNAGEGTQVDITAWKSLEDDSGNPDDMGDLSYDEWAIAFVEANASISVFVGGDRGYGGTWGGETEYVGQFFAYVPTDKDRWIKIFALEDNTYYEVKIDGVTSASGTLNLGKSATIKVPMGRGAVVTTNKPVITKMFGGWEDDTPSEDISLLVNFKPVRLAGIQPISIGPVLALFRLDWEMQENLRVWDYLLVWNSSPTFTFERHIAKAPYSEFNGSIRVFDLELLDKFDYQEIQSNVPLSINEFISAPEEYTIAYWNSTTNNSIAVGIFGRFTKGYAQINYVGAISGFFKETTGIHLIEGWNSSIYLPGGFENESVIKFLVAVGENGEGIWSIANSSRYSLKYRPNITVGAIEDVLVDVNVSVVNLDNIGIKNVSITLSSNTQQINKANITDDNGLTILGNVPASDDYVLTVHWSNHSDIFSIFPTANKQLSVVINGTMNIKLKIYVKNMQIQIRNVDDKPVNNSRVWLIGNYSTQVIVNTTLFSADTADIMLNNMPVGTASEAINYTVYVEYYTRSTLSPIKITNTTSTLWDQNPVSTTIYVSLEITKLTVKVVSLDNKGIPGASVAIRNGTGGDIFASKSTDMSNETVFEDIPTGIGYVFEVRYAGYSNTSYQRDVLSETYVIIKLPLMYGQTPLLVYFDKTDYYATVGSTLRIFIEVKANYTDNSNWWLENVEPDAIWIDIVNATNLSDYRVQNAIPMSLGNGTFYYDVVLTEDLYPNAGDFRIYVRVRKIAFMPGENYSTMHVSVPAETRIEDYGYEREYWGANYTVWITLTDKSTGNPIVDAVVVAKIIKGGNTYRTLNLAHVGNGTYKAYTVLDGNITVDSYDVNISINRPGIESLYTIFPLTVENAPTDYVYSAYTTVEFYDNFTVIVQYRRIDPHRINDYVSGATITYYVANATTGEKVYPSVGVLYGSEYAPGKYNITFNASLLGSEGNYKIYINITKTYYEKKEFSFLFQVIEVQTRATPTVEEISIEYGEEVVVKVYYKTLDDVPIPNAYATLNISGISFVYNVKYNHTEGYYVFNFSSNQSGFSIGTYSMVISFEKSHYESAMCVITLNILPISTKLVPNSFEYRVYYGENITMMIFYATMENVPIENANFTIEIPGVASFSYDWDYNRTSGWYVFIIPSNQSAFNIGAYVVNIEFNKTHYSPQSISVKLVIEEIPTRIVPSTTEIVVYYGENVSFYVTYETLDGASIIDANVNLEIVDYASIPYIIYYNDSLNAYVFTFNTTEAGLAEGYYTIRVTALKTYYEPQEITIELTIKPIGTLVLYVDTYTMYVDENLTIPITYYDEVNDVYIGDANLNYEVRNLSGVTMMSGSIISENGTYIIYIEAMELPPGTYLITFNVTKEHYVPRVGQITLTVKKVAISIAYDETLNMTWSENRTILFNIISERGEKPEGIAINATLYDESLTIVTTLPCIDQGDGTYSVSVDSWNLTPGSTYYLYVYFGSDIYAEEDAIVTIYVDYLEIYLRYEETSYSVEKNPITGGAASTITIGIFYENGLPVSNAGVIYELICGGEVIETGYLEEYDPEMSPGKYRVTIKWDDKSPDTYILRIRIESLYIRGKRVDASNVIKPVTLGVHRDLEISFNVDYPFGTITIFGRKMPVVIVVPVLVAVIGGGVFLAYRWYLWYVLPWEVKELIRILNNIEKGIWTYEAPERSQYIMEMISRELAVETKSSR